jgi:hypothetical protein
MMNRTCLRLLAAASASGCLLCLSAPVQAQSRTYRSGVAQVSGCEQVIDISPEVYNYDPVKGDRQRTRSMARLDSGTKARATGGVVLGSLVPLHVKAVSTEIQPGCTFSSAFAQAVTSFTDWIDVTAGNLPVGTPVTYTATIDYALEMPRPGDGCFYYPNFRSLLGLGNAFGVWNPGAPFSGTHRMTVSKTVAVGDRMLLEAEAWASVSAQRNLDSENFCAENSVRMTDTARITLTANVPGANTTSIKGIRYGLPR